MKVSVITRHAITNYGSLLQTLATQLVLEKMGHQCEIINYVRDDESYLKHEVTLLKRKPNWYNNKLKRLCYLILRQPESYLAGKRFEKERKKLLKQSILFTDFNELKSACFDADVYMTGSDQVWGPVTNGTYDSAYCLSFVPEGKKKISYAASFGRTEMTKENQEFFKKWIEKYDFVTVREDSAVKMLQDIGIDTEQVIDPTFLLTADQWKEYMTKPISGRYILVYQLHNDSKVGEYAKKIADKKGIPLIRISPSFHQIIRPGKFVWCPKIGEFLSYIQNTECLITDSFHGTAFAINLNVPFVEILPNNNTGTRNKSILTLTGLSDRILQNEEDIGLVDKPINYKRVNEILDEKRNDAMYILKRIVNEERI